MRQIDIGILVADADRKAKLTLMGLLSVFLLSLFLFLYAGVFAKQNNEFTNHAEEARLEAELAEISQNIQNIEAELAEISQNISKYSGENEALARDDNLLREDLERLSNLKKSFEHFDENYKRKLQELEIRRSSRLEELKTRNQPSLESTVSTAITRIGAVMLSVFMMQILLSFYRYFLRLSNYYKAKLLAFREARSTEEGLAVIKSLSPEHIAFGKEPQMPVEQLIEIIKLTK